MNVQLDRPEKRTFHRIYTVFSISEKNNIQCSLLNSGSANQEILLIQTDGDNGPC